MPPAEHDGHAAGHPELAADLVGVIIFGMGFGGFVGRVDACGPLVHGSGVCGDVECLEGRNAAGDDEVHDEGVEACELGVGHGGDPDAFMLLPPVFDLVAVKRKGKNPRSLDGVRRRRTC